MRLFGVVYRDEIPPLAYMYVVHIYFGVSGKKPAFLTGEKLMFRGPSAGSYINVTKVFLCLVETAPL
jgi:hypothetical protein